MDASTVQPPGMDVAALSPVLQSLIDRHDGAVAAVLADPRVALDEANPLLATYRALFEPSSTFPSTVVAGWQREAAQGLFYRPGAAGVMRQSTVVTVTPESDDEVAFTICVNNSIVITDEAGNPVESQSGVTAGDIRAVRLDGTWLLRDLSQAPPDGCLSAGAGS